MLSAQQPGATAPLDPNAAWNRHYEQERELFRLKAERPSLVAPLILMAAGFGMAGSSLFIGALANLGDCSYSSSDADGGRIDHACGGGIDTRFVVMSAIAGSIAVVGIAWLTERLIARNEHRNKLLRKQAQLFGSNSPPRVQFTPTVGGANLRLTF